MKRSIKNVFPVEMFLFICFLISFLAILPSTVLATITIGTPIINKANAYEQEDVVLTIPVVSTNDVTSVIAEMKNMTLDMVNSSFVNYTTSLVGYRTSGNWIYFFKLGQGIYVLNRVIATDNTTMVQIRSFETSTIGFKVLPSTSNNTINATNATSTTTTTETSTQTTTATTESTSDTSTPLVLPGYVLNNIESLFKNPVYMILIALVVALPIIVLFFILAKSKEKPILPEDLQKV